MLLCAQLFVQLNRQHDLIRGEMQDRRLSHADTMILGSRKKKVLSMFEPHRLMFTQKTLAFMFFAVVLAVCMSVGTIRDLSWHECREQRVVIIALCAFVFLGCSNVAVLALIAPQLIISSDLHGIKRELLWESVWSVGCAAIYVAFWVIFDIFLFPLNELQMHHFFHLVWPVGLVFMQVEIPLQHLQQELAGLSSMNLTQFVPSPKTLRIYLSVGVYSLHVDETECPLLEYARSEFSSENILFLQVPSLYESLPRVSALQYNHIVISKAVFITFAISITNYCRSHRHQPLQRSRVCINMKSSSENPKEWQGSNHPMHFNMKLRH